MLISHDRDFLDDVIGQILHIEHQTAKLYSGNYSAFERQRAEHLAQQDAQYQKQQKEVAHLTSFVDRFRGQLINIHPSLLPKYRGLNTHQRALDAGEREGGATVHFVTADLDEGPGILQTPVPIVPGDTAASLASRVLPFEHKLYPHAANLLLTGQVSLKAQGAVWGDEILPPGGRLWRPNSC